MKPQQFLQKKKQLWIWKYKEKRKAMDESRLGGKVQPSKDKDEGSKS